jgi:hypothetical protein
LNIAPSGYVFLPVEDFDQPTYVHKFAEPERQMEMLRSSRNITRLERRKSTAGNVFVAGGPDPAMIASTIRESRGNPDLHPVPQLKVVFSDKLAAEHAGDLVEGDTMFLFAPKLESTAAVRPKEVKETVRITALAQSWPETSPEHEAEWRAMVQREAVEAAALARAAQENARRPRTAVRANQAPPSASARVADTKTSAPARMNPLNPSSLQPAAGLFKRR